MRTGAGWGLGEGEDGLADGRRCMVVGKALCADGLPGSERSVHACLTRTCGAGGTPPLSSAVVGAPRPLRRLRSRAPDALRCACRSGRSSS